MVCIFSLKKKDIKLSWSLKLTKTTLNDKNLTIKIISSACPGRDRSIDEKKLEKQKSKITAETKPIEKSVQPSE